MRLTYVVSRRISDDDDDEDENDGDDEDEDDDDASGDVVISRLREDSLQRH